MAASSTATSHEDVRVVIIDTQYVETDALSFKSVVQRLTGKDCSVSWIEKSSFSGRKTEITKVAGKGAAEETGSAATVGVGYGGGGGGGFEVSMLTKGLSFKDLDRMILELEAPPMDELKWLWAD